MELIGILEIAAQPYLDRATNDSGLLYTFTSSKDTEVKYILILHEGMTYDQVQMLHEDTMG